MTNIRKVSRRGGEHYVWGENCSGWHLVQSHALSVIEESMPPGTKEKRHFHNFSEQFFHVLNGTAVFDVEGRVFTVEKGAGVHVPPQVIHRIRNDGSTELEFLVVSRPSTRGDRIDEPFVEPRAINLDGKRFQVLSSIGNGDVGGETVFHYRQDGDIVWATYEGGSVRFGTLSGCWCDDKILFNYQHRNTAGEFMTGKCESTPEITSSGIRLREEWKWTCGDFSRGESVLEEVNPGHAAPKACAGDETGE